MITNETVNKEALTMKELTKQIVTWIFLIIGAIIGLLLILSIFKVI